ncbi:hypothetical protein BLA29_003425, partial [Euroglyphus maynei]
MPSNHNGSITAHHHHSNHSELTGPVSYACHSGKCHGACINGGKKGGDCNICNCDTCQRYRRQQCICDRWVVPWKIYRKKDT